MDCNFKVGMGDVDIEGNITGKLDADCGLGNMELELTNSYNDFNYAINVGAGNVEIEDKEYSGIGNNMDINNNADKTMNIKCGLGNVSVEFMEMY